MCILAAEIDHTDVTGSLLGICVCVIFCWNPFALLFEVAATYASAVANGPTFPKQHDASFLLLAVASYLQVVLPTAAFVAVVCLGRWLWDRRQLPVPPRWCKPCKPVLQCLCPKCTNAAPFELSVVALWIVACLADLGERVVAYATCKVKYERDRPSLVLADFYVKT